MKGPGQTIRWCVNSPVRQMNREPRDSKDRLASPWACQLWGATQLLPMQCSTKSGTTPCGQSCCHTVSGCYKPNIEYWQLPRESGHCQMPVRVVRGQKSPSSGTSGSSGLRGHWVQRALPAGRHGAAVDRSADGPQRGGEGDALARS